MLPNAATTDRTRELFGGCALRQPPWDGTRSLARIAAVTFARTGTARPPTRTCIMRKRSSNARTERAGINAVDDACNALNLIWRDLLQEDVGVDGTIEVVIDEFPSGKLVGAQVKSGRSYMRSETDTAFRFYPDPDDLAYWAQLSIPLFLFVHDPEDRTVYWVDITKNIQERSADPLGPAYIAFTKTNVLDEAFAQYLKGLFDLASYDEAQFALVRSELEAIRPRIRRCTFRHRDSGSLKHRI